MLLPKISVRPRGCARTPTRASCLRFAFWLSAAITLAILIAPGPARAAIDTSGPVISGGPTSLVESVIDQATAAARDGPSPADRQKKLRAIAVANFDFTDMARTSLSYHWSQLTPQQRDQFVPPFTSFMENVYVSIITRGVLRILGTFMSFTGYVYSNELRDHGADSINQSNVTFTGQEMIGDGYAEVHSSMVIPGDPQLVPVDYLLKREGGTWKICDLEIDAISVMANYSNQFDRVINDDGYPALVRILQKKTHELDALLVTSR